MGNVQLQPWTNFDLKNPDCWLTWRRRFQEIHVASGLSETDESRQISMLLYCIDPEAEKVLDSTKITSVQWKKYNTVVAKLYSFFHVRKNTILEWTRFNYHCQGEDEIAEQVITSLFVLADNCNYGDLRDEVMHNRLIVGIKEAALSERLQMYTDLTLDRTIKAVRQTKAIRERQSVLNKAEASRYTRQIG